METNTPTLWDGFWGQERGGIYRLLKASLTRAVESRMRRFSGPILEAGCGEATLLGQLDQEVVGLDFSGAACKHAKKQTTHVVKGDIHNLPFKPVFSVVYNQGVVQTDVDPLQTVKDMMKVAKKRGQPALYCSKKR